MAIKTTSKSNSLIIMELILITIKFISYFLPKIATLFVAKLFTTPIKHGIPKREMEMESKSVQKKVIIPSINKEIQVYTYGQSNRKILLVHGWSGRGTQLFKIADEVVKAGYSTISFDAPAHGKSAGKTTIMVDFIACILEIDKQFGPFEIAIGHSLGGMSVLNSIKKGMKVNQAIVIGSGDIVQDILDDFVAKLGLKPKISLLLRLHFEKKYKENMDNYSAYLAAANISIPVLVIHDENDIEVPVKAGIHIYKYLKNGELLLTKGLGHRKILGNPDVIEKIVNFIAN